MASRNKALLDALRSAGIYAYAEHQRRAFLGWSGGTYRELAQGIETGEVLKRAAGTLIHPKGGRTVVTLVHADEARHVGVRNARTLGIGVANCSVEDYYEREVGVELALARAVAGLLTTGRLLPKLDPTLPVPARPAEPARADELGHMPQTLEQAGANERRLEGQTIDAVYRDGDFVVLKSFGPRGEQTAILGPKTKTDPSVGLMIGGEVVDLPPQAEAISLREFVEHGAHVGADGETRSGPPPDGRLVAGEPKPGQRVRLTDFVGATFEGVVRRTLVGGRDEGLPQDSVRVEFEEGSSTSKSFETNLPLTVEVLDGP